MSISIYDNGALFISGDSPVLPCPFEKTQHFDCLRVWGRLRDTVSGTMEWKSNFLNEEGFINPLLHNPRIDIEFEEVELTWYGSRHPLPYYHGDGKFLAVGGRRILYPFLIKAKEAVDLTLRKERLLLKEKIDELISAPRFFRREQGHLSIIYLDESPELLDNNPLFYSLGDNRIFTFYNHAVVPAYAVERVFGIDNMRIVKIDENEVAWVISPNHDPVELRGVWYWVLTHPVPRKNAVD
jgi:hypothetical protein